MDSHLHAYCPHHVAIVRSLAFATLAMVYSAMLRQPDAVACWEKADRLVKQVPVSQMVAEFRAGFAVNTGSFHLPSLAPLRLTFADSSFTFASSRESMGEGAAAGQGGNVL
jgi:hypothetical protein